VTHQCADGRTDAHGQDDPVTGGQEAHEHCRQSTDERSSYSVPCRDRRDRQETQHKERRSQGHEPTDQAEGQCEIAEDDCLGQLDRIQHARLCQSQRRQRHVADENRRSISQLWHDSVASLIRQVRPGVRPWGRWWAQRR